LQGIHKVKAKVGDARVCPLAQAFLAKRFDGKKVATSTKSNALNAFRKAVEKGVEYNENAARAAKKGAKAGGGTIMIAISSGAKAKDAAAKLRAGFNKMKESGDELAKLAASCSTHSTTKDTATTPSKPTATLRGGFLTLG
jgi:hypothetical protein